MRPIAMRTARMSRDERVGRRSKMRDARDTPRPPAPKRRASLLSLKRYGLLLALALLVCAAASCRSGANDEASGIVVVNAPASGVVKRVLVSEGATVNEGAGVVEIVVRAQPQP